MPQDNAATQTGAAQGEDKQPLTPEQIEEIKQAGHRRRVDAMSAIKVDRGDDGEPTPIGDEDENAERDRILAEAAAQTARQSEGEGDAAAQVKATQDDEDLLIDLTNASKVRFRTKVDGREEIVTGDKVLARYQKDAAADVRLANATAARQEAEALLAEANKKLAEANSVQEKKAAEAAVASSKEKLAAIVKESFDALYGGEQEKATELLTSGLTDILAATLTSRGETATSSVDANQLAAEVEQRIEVKGALSKLFSDYPAIKMDPDYAAAADRARAGFEAEGYSRSAAIALAGESVAKKFGLEKSSGAKSEGAGETTLAGKRAAKQDGIDSIPRAGSIVSGDDAGNRPRTTSQVIADMAARRRGGVAP